MAKAKTGDLVKVYYTGKLDDGTLFDSTEQDKPLEFEIGAGQVIPGFEEAVEGMSPGEAKSQTIPAEQAYGPHRKEMTIEVEREHIPEEVNVNVGQKLQVVSPSGEKTRVTVTALSDSTVTLDANHPLAGKDLQFDIELLEIVSPAEA